jgi:hypothetical protein
MLNPIPWYKSPVQIAQITTAISALIAVFPRVGIWLGLTSPSAINDAVTAVFGVIGFVAPIVGSIVRAKSPVQPLTLTQASADAKITPETAAATGTFNAYQAAKSTTSSPPNSPPPPPTQGPST